MLDELVSWWRTLDPAYAFLLCVPFIVAAVGIAVNCRDRAKRRP